jgi:hypothetical protein
MPSTAVNAIPYPDLATPAQPDVPADLQALAEAVDRKVIGSYANAAARDAAIPSPTDGMGLAYLQDVDQYTARVNGAWVSVPVANATWQDPAAGTAGLRTIGTGAQQAAAGTTTTTVTAAEARDIATPGHPCAGLTPAAITMTGSLADIVAAPATSHRRVVKSILISGNATAGAATVTWSIAGSTTHALSLGTNTQFGGPLAVVLNAGEAFQISSSVASMHCAVTYVDIPSTSTVVRLGMASGSGSGTLVTSVGGSDRVITQLLLGNTSTTATATMTISVGALTLPSVRVPTNGLAAVGLIAIPAGSAVTYAGDGVTAVSMVASGYTA